MCTQRSLASGVVLWAIGEYVYTKKSGFRRRAVGDRRVCVHKEIRRPASCYGR
ncbi:hypothetical protein DPMN_172698 [Dreissena polymorpha]|uniref:Uncharacterized protein n=1 Tax=Dreissena polymorpha TaxID=45954 RepID=A0A9D4IGA9_DREPO|nr:hypothetical protein DPMN_172698 [Dreissena polymorpha]